MAIDLVEEIEMRRKNKPPELPVDLANAYEPMFRLCCDTCPRCGNPYWIWPNMFEPSEHRHICTRCDREWSCGSSR